MEFSKSEKVGTLLNILRLGMALGKHGIWILLFPDRGKTGNCTVTERKV